MPAYKLGVLSFSGGDILKMENWKKLERPVFEHGTTSLYGPGHASFIKDKKGDYIVYHHKISTSPGWERLIKVQDFKWSKEGLPLFGSPR